MTHVARLSGEEIRTKLAEVPGWELKQGKLYRELVFEDFVSAFAFMTSVALIAEGMEHHPEWSNVYNRVEIELSTHDVGGLTERDFELAAAVNRSIPA
jgi:4a-hydroxytetrahydrobiopterin dehydratase